MPTNKRWAPDKARAARPAVLVAVATGDYLARETLTATFDAAEGGPLSAERRWRRDNRGRTILDFATLAEYQEWASIGTRRAYRHNPLWPNPDPDAYLLGIWPDADDAPPAATL